MKKTLLAAILFALPFSLRKVLFVTNPLAPGVFNEYMDTSIFLFDILIVLFVTYCILEHILIYKSSSWSWVRRLFHVEQFSPTQKTFHVEHFVIAFILSLSTFLSILLFGSFFELFILVKIVIYGIFFLFVYNILFSIVPRGTIFLKKSVSGMKFVPRGTFIHENTDKDVPRGTNIDSLHQHLCSTWNKLTKLIPADCSTWNIYQVIIFISITFQVFLGLIQVFLQRSIGLRWLGEQVLSVNIPGVSTIIINGVEFLRAYGTFLHPNIYAGYLITSLLFYFLLKKCSTWNIYTPKYSLGCSTWNNGDSFSTQIVPRGTFIHENTDKDVPRGTMETLFTGIIGIGILISFSKVAWLVYGLFLIEYFWNVPRGTFFSKLNTHIVPRGTILKKVTDFCSTWNTRRILLKKCSTWNILILSLIILGGVFFLFQIDLYYYIVQPILERKVQYLSILSIPRLQVLLGSGFGGYVSWLSTSGFVYESFQLQPVHNFFLMALIEVGILPLLILFFFFWQGIHTFFRNIFSFAQTNNLRSLLFGVILLGSFDHYFWDIEVAQLMLGFIFIFLLGISTRLGVQK